MDRLSCDMAIELKEHNVKAITLHPGGGQTEITAFPDGESPKFVGRAVYALIEKADDSFLSKSNGKTLFTIDLAKKFEFREDYDHDGSINEARYESSKPIKEILNKKLKDIATIWNGEGKNPYEEAIQSSSFFIVTSDSTSMISEAAISGRPIYIYHLPFKRKSARISNFHDEFSKLGITRDLKNVQHLENWEYNVLNESDRIGSIIKKRIIEDTI